MAKNPPWTDEENDCIVANYFAMLIEKINNREINKSEYRRKLQKRIARSNGAIEFKNRNISYLLNFAFGLRYIAGYLPARHHQSTLLQAIERWVAVHGLPQENILQSDHLEGSELLPIVPPPIHRNRPPDGDIEFVWKIAQKYDIAERDQRNRALGKRGKKRVLGHEKAVLRTSGRSDLAGRVQWISEEVGDGAGYDIASFDREGRERLIEVKTTNGAEYTPFFITHNEKDVAERHCEAAAIDKASPQWLILRLYNFTNDPRAFELRPPLERSVSFTPMNYRADFL